jgi:hypothetical protein
MNERITRKTVAFTQPFFIEDLDREQAPGTYEVEIIEEPIEGLSFIAYRVVSTSIVVPLGPHSHQLVRIDPSLVRSAVHDLENETSRQT